MPTNYNKMDWVAVAEEYIGKFGWGARGKNIGVSRMLNDSEINVLKHTKWLVTRCKRAPTGFGEQYRMVSQ